MHANEKKILMENKSRI